MPTVASRGAGRIAVEPQVFDLLVYLVQNRERVASKDDLIALGPPIVAN
jgi:DNA-binding winged helix-turn-helix (wHTH) protein